MNDPWLLIVPLLLAFSCLAQAKQKPDLVFADLIQVLEKKTAIKNDDPKALADHKKLIKSADRILALDLLSVTDKKKTPPSGDKRDYLSLAPYWWPDPDKPDGLPFIRRDGRVNPENRGEHTDDSRKSSLFSRLHTLGHAAFLSDDPRYARKAVAQLETWFVHPDTRMNPHLEFAQGVPGRSDGRCFGIIEWAGIDRVVTSIQLLRLQGALPADTDQALNKWFTDYLLWLQTSENGQEERDCRNNHATWYDVQVAGLLLFLDRPGEARTVLEQVKSKRIATQIEPDGRQPLELARTKSLSYSKMNLNAFTRLADLGKKADVDLWNYETKDGRSIRKARTFLAPYLKGEKKWPYQQLGKKD